MSFKRLTGKFKRMPLKSQQTGRLVDPISCRERRVQNRKRKLCSRLARVEKKRGGHLRKDPWIHTDCLLVEWEGTEGFLMCTYDSSCVWQMVNTVRYESGSGAHMHTFWGPSGVYDFRIFVFCGPCCYPPVALSVRTTMGSPSPWGIPPIRASTAKAHFISSGQTGPSELKPFVGSLFFFFGSV